MLSEVSNFVNTARADTFLLEASRGIIPASCRAPWSFDGERIEASKVALRAQWWAAGAPLLSQRDVDPTPPAKDDGCIACCVTQ